MTCVIACICEGSLAVIASDSAVSYASGFRRLTSQGKWWDMGNLIIGESGSDLALSRIRQKTLDTDDWGALSDPYTFSRLVCAVQQDVRGHDGAEPLEAELLHVGAEASQPTLHVVGGDGGVTGPFEYTAVGHGAALAMPILDILLDAKRCKRKTVARVGNIVLEALSLVARYADSVSAPFHLKTFDPAEPYRSL